MENQAKLDELEMLQSMYPDQITIDLQDYQDCIEAAQSSTTPEHGTLRFSLRVDNVVFEVTLPPSYPSSVIPEIRIRAEHLNRDRLSSVQQSLDHIIREMSSDGECVVLQCINEILDQALTNQEQAAEIEPGSDDKITVIRMWYYAHHIYSKTKRSSMLQWSKDLCLTGFILPGKPGIICIEGETKKCKEFNALVRAMNWQLLKLQHEELDVKTEKFIDFKELIFDVHGSRGNHQDLGQFKDYLSGLGLGDVFQILFQIGK